MPGMYPDDQVLEIFGETVAYPGLDPVTHKFTDGSFSDPLVKPSHIPAASMNLILDNLENFISGLGLTPDNTNQNQLLEALQNKYATKDWLLNYFMQPGTFYTQLPDAPNPAELGLEGTWEMWNDRAVMYGIAPTPPPVGFANDYDEQNASIWHLNTDGTVATLGTKKYARPLGYIYNARQKCGNVLTEDDYEIGQQITYFEQPYYVWEPICPAGTFPSFADGGVNRPPYNGGVAGDQSRPITGSVGSYMRHENGSGVFYVPETSVYNVNASQIYLPNCGWGVYFDSGRVVPTGSQFAPSTFSIILWRRVA